MQTIAQIKKNEKKRNNVHTQSQIKGIVFNEIPLNIFKTFNSMGWIIVDYMLITKPPIQSKVLDDSSEVYTGHYPEI